MSNTKTVTDLLNMKDTLILETEMEMLNVLITQSNLGEFASNTVNKMRELAKAIEEVFTIERDENMVFGKTYNSDVVSDWLKHHSW